MTGWIGAASLAAFMAAVAMGAGWLQHQVLDEHRDTVIIRTPRTSAEGAAITREQIAAYEAEVSRCEAAGHKCIVFVEVDAGLRRNPPEAGWLVNQDKIVK